MQAALAAADRGVRSCLVMLPRSVHGQGERHGFIPQLIAAARAKGVSGYIGDGTSRWPAVHVKDAASLYRLAIEQAPAGAVLNAVGDEGVPVREIAEAIGRHLNLPARSLPAEEFGGMLVHILSTDMPASSSRLTQEFIETSLAGLQDAPKPEQAVIALVIQPPISAPCARRPRRNRACLRNRRTVRSAESMRPNGFALWSARQAASQRYRS